MNIKTTRVKLGGITGANQLEAQFFMHPDGLLSMCFESGAARMFVNVTPTELHALSNAAADVAREAFVAEATA